MASASSMPSPDKKRYLNSLLECSICLETFDEPRTLSCLHSFCKKCLENFVDGKREDELNCPVCRTKFTLNEDGVAGMTRNHFICNMIDALSIQDTCIPCAHCEKPSVCRCVTCEQFMCDECEKDHNAFKGFRGHDVLKMKELSKPENRSKIKGKSYCKKHSTKKLELYCETCEELICDFCMAFEHVRPDHICYPLEEIAQKAREKLNTICMTLESKGNRTERYYDDLAKSSLHLDKNLNEVKKNILQRKDFVLKLAEDALEKKAQTLIEETEEIAQAKKQTIGEELRRVSDHKAGQKKTYDMAKALVDNGSNEEIMLSYNLVQQSVEDAAGGYEIKEIDDKLPDHSNQQLGSMFLDKIKAMEFPKAKPRTLQRGKSYPIQGRPTEPAKSKLTFDPSTGKLILAPDLEWFCDEMFVGIGIAKQGYGPCELLDE